MPATMLSAEEYQFILRRDFTSFIERSFYELNPQTILFLGPHIEVIATKLEACRKGKIKRLIINLSPRHLKSHCARSPLLPGISDTIRRVTSSARATARIWRKSWHAIPAIS